MECNICVEKDKTIASLRRILLKAQTCDAEKYFRIKRLEAIIKNLPNQQMQRTQKAVPLI